MSARGCPVKLVRMSAVGFEPNDTADLSTNDVAVNNDSSSGYHSNQEDSGATMQQQQLSSLELENQLLKNEVASLNQEMSSIMQRARDAQEGIHVLCWVIVGYKPSVSWLSYIETCRKAMDLFKWMIKL